MVTSLGVSAFSNTILNSSFLRLSAHGSGVSGVSGGTGVGAVTISGQFPNVSEVLLAPDDEKDSRSPMIVYVYDKQEFGGHLSISWMN